MHILIYTAKREKPFVLGRAGLSLSVLSGLLVLAVWAAVWHNGQNGSYGAEINRIEQELYSGRARLDAAVSGIDSLRASLEIGNPRGLEQFLRQMDSLRGGTPPETVSVSAPVSSVNIAIQVSSHPLEQDARREAESLALRTGLHPVVEGVRVGARLWHRVLIEGFREESAARTLADSLLRTGAIREYVIQELGRPSRQIP